MNEQNLITALAKTAPFTRLTKGECQTLLSLLDVVHLSAWKGYDLPLNNFGDYFLCLQGKLFRRREPLDRNRAYSLLLASGAMLPMPKQRDGRVKVSILSIGSGAIGKLSLSDLKGVCSQSVEISKAIIHALSLGLEQVTDELTLCMSSQLSGRLARLLLELEQFGKVTYTQDRLAWLLGTYRETVSYLLGRFRKQGWVATSHKGINLLDFPSLQQMAAG